MNNAEFDVIKKYFTFTHGREDVLLAGGDDCASVDVPAGKELVITVDTLVSGVHFPADTSAQDVAYKSLMVNLSDLAAMGAEPAWITLAITLPDVDEAWLTEFSQQFSSLLTEYKVALIGGDTTHGPLSITVQAMGLVEKDKKMLRSQAKAGDKIYVTGCIGDAAIGLKAVFGGIDDAELASCIERLNRPDARVRFAQELSAISNCAIDVSDGLLADLGHIITASDCGAVIRLGHIPVSDAAVYYFSRYEEDVIDWPLLLTQGDDYELCFTISEDKEAELEKLAEKHGVRVSCIGEITAGDKLRVVDANNGPVQIDGAGYQHF